MPAAPCTSGSMITACATSPSWATSRRSISPRWPGSALSVSNSSEAVERMEEVDAADRDRARSCRRGRHPQRHELQAPLLAALAPVLERHLERDLGGRGARVGVEDAREPGRRQLDQALGEAPSPGRCERPSIVLCAMRLSWSRTAASMRGWPCRADAPNDETPSMWRPPLHVDGIVPLARSTTIGSSSIHPRCWVNGCQRNVRSAATRSMRRSYSATGCTIAP